MTRSTDLDAVDSGTSISVLSATSFASMTDTAAVSRSIQPDVAALQWLALALTPAMGPIRGHGLVQRLGNVECVFMASLTELKAAGLPALSAQSIALGKSHSLGQPALGAVGTRHPKPHGMGMAERLSNDLASRGLVTVSGMARGVDAHAHRGALDGKGKTGAVWRTGIDVPYPRENKRVAESIVGAGAALVPEFPIGAFAAPQNFPIRNRIISGSRLVYSSWKQGSTAERVSPRDARWSREEISLRFQATSRTGARGVLTH